MVEFAHKSSYVSRNIGQAHSIVNLLLMNKPSLEIEYCTQCRFILRAAWMAQELLMTFQTKVGEVVLIRVPAVLLKSVLTEKYCIRVRRHPPFGNRNKSSS